MRAPARNSRIFARFKVLRASAVFLGAFTCTTPTPEPPPCTSARARARRFVLREVNGPPTLSDAFKVTGRVLWCTMSAARALWCRAGRGVGDVSGLRPLTCSPVPPSSPGRALSSVSATRRGLPKEKMSENGVSSRAKVLTIDTMNPTVKKVEYAVRGPIVQRAVELEKELLQVCLLFSSFELKSYFFLK